MRELCRRLGPYCRCVPTCVIAVAVLFFATGWYYEISFDGFDSAAYMTFSLLLLVGILGAIDDSPVVARFAGSMLVAVLIAANTDLSTSHWGTQRWIGIALSLSVWLFPWLAITILRCIPILGWEFGRRNDDGEMVVTKRPISIGDLFATIACVAVAIALIQFFVDREHDFLGEWESQRSTYIPAAILSAFLGFIVVPTALWIVFSQWRWPFIVAMPIACGLVAACIYMFWPNVEPGGQVFFVHLVVYLAILLCWRLSGLRLTTKRRTVVNRATSRWSWHLLSRSPYNALLLFGAWFIVAWVGGTFGRHELHRIARVEYEGQRLVDVDLEKVGIAQVRRWLSSSHLRHVERLKLGADIDNPQDMEFVVDQLTRHAHVNVLEIGSKLSENQITRLLSAKRWLRLNVGIATSMLRTLEIATANPHTNWLLFRNDCSLSLKGNGKTARLSCLAAPPVEHSRYFANVTSLQLNLHTREARDAVTNDTLERWTTLPQLKFLRIDSYDYSYAFTIAGLAEHTQHVPHLRVRIPFESLELEYRGREVVLHDAEMWQTTAESMQSLSPTDLLLHNFELTSRYDENDVTDGDETKDVSVPEEVAELWGTFARDVQTLTLRRTRIDEPLLKIFASHDAVHLLLASYTLDGRTARAIISHPNITTITLDGGSLTTIAAELLARADTIETIRCTDESTADQLKQVRGRKPEIEILSKEDQSLRRLYGEWDE